MGVDRRHEHVVRGDARGLGRLLPGRVDQLAGHHERVYDHDRQPGGAVVEHEGPGEEGVRHALRLGGQEPPADNGREMLGRDVDRGRPRAEHLRLCRRGGSRLTTDPRAKHDHAQRRNGQR